MKSSLANYALLILLLLAVSATDNDKHCNKQLLAQFKLTGRQKPKDNQYMDVCGSTMDNCCTIVDEMMIVKYWSEYTKPQIIGQASQMMHMYKSLFTLHSAFASLEINTLPTHHIYERWVPYFKTSCSLVFKDDFDDDMDGLQKPKRGYRRLKGYSRKVKGDSDSIKKDVGMIGQDEKSFAASVKESLENYFYNKNFDLEAGDAGDPDGERKLSEIIAANSKEEDGNARDRKLKDVTHKLAISEDQIKALTNMEKVKTAFKKTVDKSVKSIHRLFDRKMKQAYFVKKKTEREMAYLDHLLNESKDHPEFLEQVARKLDSKVSDDDDFNEKLLKSIYKSKKTTEEARQYIQDKRNALGGFVDSLDAFIAKGTEKEKAYLASHITVPLDNEYMSKLINTIITNEFPIKRNLQVFHLKPRKLPRFPPQSLPMNRCVSNPQLLYRKFYILNEDKYRFCDNVYIYIKEFDVDSFLTYIMEARTAYLRIAFGKKSIYCAVCDYNKQKFFDMKKELIYLNEGTCNHLLHRFRQYFEWKNIIFVEYIYNIFQYIQCFETPGNSIDFPFKTIIDKHERQMFFIKRCLKNFEGARGFEYCHFFCKNYKYHMLSGMIEGDLKFMKAIYMRMVSFLRKQNIEIPRDYQEEIKNKFGKFMDLPVDHFDEKTAEDIERMGVVGPDPRKLRAEVVEAVYDTRKKETPLSMYTTVFIDDDGLQPFTIDEGTRFDIDMEDRVRKYIKSIGGKTLKSEIVKVALVPNETMTNFNNDIGLGFFDINLDFLTPQVTATPEKIDLVYDQLNRKEVDKPTDKGPKVDAMTEQVRDDGLPELEYVFSND